MTARRGDGEERRSPTKKRTCSAGQAIEPVGNLISRLTAADSASDNVLGEEEKVQTANDVDLVQWLFN